MDIIGWLTAMYVALWISVNGDDLKKDISKSSEQTQQVEQKK